MERDAGDWSPSPGLPPGRHPLRPPHSSAAPGQPQAPPVRSPLTSRPGRHHRQKLQVRASAA